MQERFDFMAENRKFRYYYLGKNLNKKVVGIPLKNLFGQHLEDIEISQIVIGMPIRKCEQ